MKKSGILLALILCAGLFTTVAAKKNSSGKAIKNGFGISLVTGIPSANFGTSVDATVDSEYQFPILIGLQLGNRWYIAPQEKFGFGIMVNWFDVSMAATSFSSQVSDITRATFDCTFIEFGPIGTFAINEDMAIDAYYNLRPTLLISGETSTPTNVSSSSSSTTFGYAGFGASHAIGAAFRWKVLNVGLEYVVGSIDCAGSYTGSLNDVDVPNQDISTNSLRILLGVKF